MRPYLAAAARGITKEFVTGAQRTQVLRGVDLDIPIGELTLLAGPSGCGKTTLLSVIAGLIDAVTGDLRVFGRDISKLSGKERVLFRRKNLGFVFQQFNLLPALTAAENAAVPLLAAGVSYRTAIAKASGLLGRLELDCRLDALPAQLSGGQQQRVALARAMVHEPNLIACDEPTSALDHRTGQAVMELLKKAAVRDGRAVVVVTHDSRAFQFGDRIAYMEDGRIERVEIRKRVWNGALKSA